MGERGKDTGRPVDSALEAEMVGEVLTALLIGGPVGSQQPHVLRQAVGGLESGLGTVRGELARPVLALESLDHRPTPVRVRSEIGWLHHHANVTEVGYRFVSLIKALRASATVIMRVMGSTGVTATLVILIP
jgi:hypothetical protein